MSITSIAPAASAPAATAPGASLAAADRAAIQQVLDQQAAAWNRHDMHAFAAGMLPDVEWINVVGMQWRGRETVERAHAALHRMPLFAHSRLVPSATEMRALTPDVAVVVERSTVEGAGPTPDGSAYPADGAVLTMVFVRTPEGWRIAHGHNTTINAAAVAHDPAAGPPR